MLENTEESEQPINKARRYAAPLSPHLGIYKPQLTSVLSILHRITGVSLVVGSLLLCYWLVSLSSGQASFETAHGFVQSWFGQILLFLWTFALSYHLLNGIRHLCWDIGIGLSLKNTYMSGWIVIAASSLLTLSIWLVN